MQGWWATFGVLVTRLARLDTPPALLGRASTRTTRGARHRWHRSRSVTLRYPTAQDPAPRSLVSIRSRPRFSDLDVVVGGIGCKEVEEPVTLVLERGLLIPREGAQRLDVQRRPWSVALYAPCPGHEAIEREGAERLLRSRIDAADRVGRDDARPVGV